MQPQLRRPPVATVTYSGRKDTRVVLMVLTCPHEVMWLAFPSAVPPLPFPVLPQVLLQVRWLLQRLLLDMLDGHYASKEGVT